MDVEDFVATFFIEAIVVAGFAYFNKINTWKLVCFSCVVNSVTQPLFSSWLKLMCTGQDYKWLRFFILGEVIVISAESLFYFLFLRRQKIGFSACVRVSGLANTASLTIGLLLPY